MFNGYDRVVVLTEIDAALLRKLNPALPLRVIPNGIDLRDFTPGVGPEDEASLIFTGNYEYAPNADAALFLAREILPRVQAAVPEAQLWLVGNAPTPDMQAISGGAIHITGRVPAVVPYLQRAAVFVSPLRLGAGIKNKVLEAMAAGKPVVATPLSAEGIGLKEGEHVLYGNSAETLSMAVVRLLRDEALRRRIGDANRAMIESRFTWERVADQYETLYHDLKRRPR